MKLNKEQKERFEWIYKDLVSRNAQDVANALKYVLNLACDSRIMEMLDKTLQYWYDLYINEWTEWCGALEIRNLRDFYNYCADDVYITDICGCELYEDIDSGKFDKEKDCLNLLYEYFGKYPLNIIDIVANMFHAIFENKW